MSGKTWSIVRAGLVKAQNLYEQYAGADKIPFEQMSIHLDALASQVADEARASLSEREAAQNAETIEAQREIIRLAKALRSIAESSCCDGCGQAALVAKVALRYQEGESRPGDAEEELGQTRLSR